MLREVNLLSPGDRASNKDKHLFFFCFLGPHLQHMEVLRLGAELEL